MHFFLFIKVENADENESEDSSSESSYGSESSSSSSSQKTSEDYCWKLPILKSDRSGYDYEYNYDTFEEEYLYSEKYAFIEEAKELIRHFNGKNVQFNLFFLSKLSLS
jgi:hypothetical protein